MKRRVAGALAILCLVIVGGALSARGIIEQAASVLKELSVAEPEAHDTFFNALWEGSAYVPGGQAVYAAASPENKAAIVRGVLTVLKAYTRTPAFRTRYAEYWDANRPQPPEPPPSVESQNADMERAVREMEEGMKNMSPEMRKELEAALKQAKAQQEAMQKDPQMKAMLTDGFKRQEAQDKAQHEQQVREYAAEHPKDPDAMIARRLKQFLEVSATVNFDAPVVKQGGKVRFANAADEQRSAEWKLCYRAGRDGTAAARAFAGEWLKELGAK